MNIIFGGSDLDELRSKYTVLELDTFRLPPDNQSVTAYAVIETIPINEIHRTTEFTDLHHNLMQEYKNRNWKYCEDAIEYLITAWSGELRTFYEVLSARISMLKDQDLGPEWDGTIIKSS